MVAIAWWRAPSAAETYGCLLRAAFDLHCFDLYRALRWPLPSDTASKVGHGEKLTVYLFRGLVNPAVTFTAGPVDERATDE